MENLEDAKSSVSLSSGETTSVAPSSSKIQKPDCSLCGKLFATQNSLVQHVRRHLGETLYPCRFCNKSFLEKCNLVRHLTSHSPSKKNTYACPTCPDKFKFKRELQKHSKLHEKKCHTRDRKQPAKRNRFSKGAINLQCVFCETKCKNPFRLQSHIRFHTKEKPYSCRICEKDFAKADALTAHKRMHTGEKPHCCDVCEKRFARWNSLKAHMRTWHQDSEITLQRWGPLCECKVCGKKFCDNYPLKIHMRIHTKEKPFPCDLCPKRFETGTNYRIHMQRHTGEKPFACDACFKDFITNVELRNHFKKCERKVKGSE